MSGYGYNNSNSNPSGGVGYANNTRNPSYYAYSSSTTGGGHDDDEEYYAEQSQYPPPYGYHDPSRYSNPHASHNHAVTDYNPYDSDPRVSYGGYGTGRTGTDTAMAMGSDAYGHGHGHGNQYGGDHGLNYSNDVPNMHDHGGSVMSGPVEDHDGNGDDDEDEDVDDNDVDFDDPRIANLPRILLMGPRRAGKTSIQRVVFHKMSPHETLFRLEATQNLERSVVDHTPLCRFTIWDFPGDHYGSEEVEDLEEDDVPHRTHRHSSGANAGGVGGGAMPMHMISMMRQPPVHAVVDSRGSGTAAVVKDVHPASMIQGREVTRERGPANEGDAQIFGRATALIFVLDAQDEPYDHVLQNFTETVRRAARANPHIAIEVFINKVDGELFLSDEAKYDCRRDVMQQVSDELADAGVMPDSVQISYHLTSIYDHSVFEAFSRVVQKLIPQLPTLENLLNVLVSTCAMEKAYLFDVASKLYISTDSSPVDIQSVELCSDMIDVVLDVSGIYGLPNPESGPIQQSAGEQKVLADGMDSMAPVVGEMASLTSGDPTVMMNATGDDDLVGTLIGQTGDLLLTDNMQGGGGGLDKDDADAAYDSDSASVIRLSKGMVLYLKEVDTMLALVCLTRSDNFRKRNLINYNIRCLKKALQSLVVPPNP